MPKILLLQFDTDPECRARREILSGIDAELVEAEPQWPGFFDVVTRERPDVIVIACSKLGRNGREAARYLNEGFNTRDIPVVLVDVPPREVEEARRSAPLAAIVDRASLAKAVQEKLGIPAR